MRLLTRILKRTWLWRFFICLYFGLKRVRVSFAANLLARIDQLDIGSGVKINNVQIYLGEKGKLVISESCWLENFVEIQTDSLVSIGRGTTIRRLCSIHGSVTIGQECIFAPNVFVSSGTHIYSAWPELSIRTQESKYYQLQEETRPPGFADRPVRISDDCWFGANVVIMPGVEIGKGCVVGANSVVTKSLPPYSVAVGSPAKVVKQRLA